MGRLEGIQEQEVLDKFKQNTADLGQDDETLLKFLRAREHDLVRAEAMIRKTLIWREENNIKSYLNWTPPTILKEEFRIQFRLTGFDFEGRPVVWIPLGRFLGKECLEQGYKEDLTKLTYHLLESVMNTIRESKASQCVALLGIEDLTYKQLMNMESMQTLYKAFQDLEMNYPEILKHLIVVNAPWMFTIGYNFIKPILSAHTISKIEIYNSDKSKWMTHLLNKMPIEAIPKEYSHDHDCNDNL